MVGGKEPPRSRPTKVPLVKGPTFSMVQASSISLSLAWVSTSIWWDFVPMEVQANHLPICTCPSGMVLQQQQVCPPWSHKSQGSYQCQSHLIIKLPKHVHKTPLFSNKCSKTLCYSTSQVLRGSQDVLLGKFSLGVGVSR
jgi:hypothetical protein